MQKKKKKIWICSIQQIECDLAWCVLLSTTIRVITGQSALDSPGAAE